MGNTKEYNRTYYLQHRQYFLNKSREYRTKERGFTDPNDTLADELAAREHQTEQELRDLGIKSIDIANDAVLFGDKWKVYNYDYEMYSITSYDTFVSACRAVNSKHIKWG